VADALKNLVTSAATRLQHGVDVSSFQGPPADWTKSAGSITWAAVKITELEANGTKYVNPYAAADWQWLKANKKGRIGYLFGHPSQDATETVDFFINQIDKLGLEDTDGVALDLEVTDGLSPAKVSAWGADVESALHSRLDRPPLLYTFINFAKAGNCAHLGGYPLWIADPSSPAGKPNVPAPWKTWTIHQYDISGSIDRDLANYTSKTAMFTALGKSKPKEPDMQNIGGKLTSGLATGRWPNGNIVVAGLGADGYIQANLLANGRWSGWKNVSPTKAKGVPAVSVWVGDHGRLYYIDESDAVIQIITQDGGKTWT